MPYASNIGLGGVNNQYGARDTGGAIGPERGRGANWVVKIDLTGRSIADAIAGFVPPVVIPKGANFNKASIRVDEAFVVTGTTPALSIGANGSVGTNFISVSEAELEAIGTKELASSGAGTWAFASATGTTAAAKIAYALTGTTPAVDATVGKATLILEYTFNTKI